jgi:drug/metabolite transporter (DMT)-like permease
MANSAASELIGPIPARTGPTAARDQAWQGIALIVGSTLFFSCADAFAKALAATLPAIEIAWFRYVTFAVMMVPLVLARGGAAAFRSERVGLQVLRGFGMVGSALLFTIGLRFLPLADATATVFVSPIFITALSIVFLGEVVGWRRWTAAAVGLLGVLIVVRPATTAFQPAALFPLLAALSWAASVIATRKMSGSEHPVTTLAYSALVGTVLLTVLLPFGWAVPSWREIGLGLALGMVSTIGHGLVVLAYNRAGASMLAPFSYVQLIGSALVGFLAFAAIPDTWTLVGGALIAASGLYTAHRERVRSRIAS